MKTMMTVQELQSLLDAQGMDFLTVSSTEPISHWKFLLEGQMETSRGVMWKGTLTNTVDGGTLLVENAGDGGCNRYSGSRETQRQFESDARVVFPNEIEAEDSFALLLDILSGN